MLIKEKSRRISPKFFTGGYDDDARRIRRITMEDKNLFLPKIAFRSSF